MAGPLEDLTLAEKPPEPDDKEAEDRFNETLKRLANTPPKPHDEMKKGRGPKAPPKSK